MTTLIGGKGTRARHVICNLNFQFDHIRKDDKQRIDAQVQYLRCEWMMPNLSR